METVQSWLHEHSKAWSSWPWAFLNDPVLQWREHPSFMVGEFLFLTLSVLSTLHAFGFLDAFRSTKRDERRDLSSRRMMLFVASWIVGFANDYVFMLLPVVDNFFQAQAVVMLTPRMPLYIVCVYNAMLYWPLLAAERVFGPVVDETKTMTKGGTTSVREEAGTIPLRGSRVAEASLAGWLCGLLYAVYDITGARFLWWTWHHDDAPIKERWLGVPCGSTMFCVLLPFSMCFLRRTALNWEYTETKTLGFLCAFSTLLMVVLINCLCLVATPWQPSIPSLRSVALLVGGLVVGIIWGVVVKRRGNEPAGTLAAEATRNCRASSETSSSTLSCDKGARTQEESTVVLRASRREPVLAAILSLYFAAFAVTMGVFPPQNSLSTGTHQIFGHCHVTDMDLFGSARKRYVCADDYPDFYFSFDCGHLTSTRASSSPPVVSSEKNAAGGLVVAPSRWHSIHPVDALAKTKGTGRAETVTWYTVCGRPHQSYVRWFLAVAGLGLLGVGSFLWAFMVTDGAGRRRWTAGASSPSRKSAPAPTRSNFLNRCVRRNMDRFLTPLMAWHFHGGSILLLVFFFSTLVLLGEVCSVFLHLLRTKVLGEDVWHADKGALQIPYEWVIEKVGRDRANDPMFMTYVFGYAYLIMIVFYTVLDCVRPGSAAVKKEYMVQPRAARDWGPGWWRTVLHML